MKAVILAGGLGTRISEETHLRPKPMIEIGGMPILWHIMKIYSHYGVNEFIICGGYKSYLIKDFFSNYFLYSSDVTFNFKDNSTIFLNPKSEAWKVTVVDTGAETQTGGRIKRIKPYLEKDEIFLMTYGDAVADINIDDLLDFHKHHGLMATVTAVEPPGRFGSLDIEANLVKKFQEKPTGDGGLINGGFFVLSSKVCDYIDGDNTIWEKDPLERLAQEKQLSAFKHQGFWQPMDTLREKKLLNSLWDENPPWKVWKP